MHVALYLKHFPADGLVNDGTSNAVAGLAAGLAENGTQVTVLCEGPARRSRRDEATGVAIECFENPNPSRRFAFSPELKRYVGDHLAATSSLCVLNGMFHPGVYAMSRWLRRAGVPYVVAPHDPYDAVVFRRNAHLKWPYWYLLERRLLRQACAVQVLDPRHGENLRRLGIRTPILVTENGVAPASVPAESQIHWRGPEGPVRLVFLGRIDAYNKGLDLLIDAFGSLGARYGARLTLQGPDWGDRAQLESQARRAGLDATVAFRAPDYERTSPEIIGEHDVFCLPSRFEGFGLAALEAMLAARVLLVAEGAGIARHIVASGCGVTVPPTAEGVAAGLRVLFGRRERWRAMGLNGRRYALEHLRWGGIASALLRDYQRLAG